MTKCGPADAVARVAQAHDLAPARLNDYEDSNPSPVTTC